MKILDYRAWSLTTRFGVLVAIGILVAACVAIANHVSRSQAVRQDRAEQTRRLVESAWGVLAAHHELEKSGAIPREEAQKRAKAVLKTLRYDEREYFWVQDASPRMVMHPIRAELDGTDLSHNADPDGKRLFVEMAAVVKAKGAGFVAYRWPKPGSTAPISKISYVKGFEPWGWIVGNGVYVDDIEAVLARLAAEQAIGLAVAAAIYLLLAVLMTRAIIGELGGEPARAAEAARRIAEGDLVTPVAVKPGDGTSLMAAMAVMREKLVALVSRINAASESIHVASREIAVGNQDLAQRTEEQAASLEETASSMEELTSAVRQSSTSSREADRLAADASRQASEGGAVVSQVVQTMSEINESSRKIEDIISVIDGIAFQTNILALNAAVEAARAGEQGRGFAVVATEVRALAGRSAEAAKEIKGLIGTSVEKVEGGTQLVAKAGGTIEGVVSAVQKVSRMVSDITAGASEQASGIEQVNQAVTQMDQVTQQNAALVEEASAAAESMKKQAEELRQLVSAFRVDGSAPSAALMAAAGD